MWEAISAQFLLSAEKNPDSYRFGLTNHDLKPLKITLPFYSFPFISDVSIVFSNDQ